MKRAFGDRPFGALSPDHPILAGKATGMDNLAVPRLRPGAGPLQPRFRILSSGKGYVIHSSLDLTTGLLGTNTYGVLGYQPAYARGFVKNLLLWTADGCKPQ